jgi:hypothetical protein
MLNSNKLYSLVFLLAFVISFSVLSINISHTFAQGAILAQGEPNVDPDQEPKGECGVNQLCNPLGSKDIPTLIGGAIKTILGIVGSIALALFIYGGFVWMTAGGNPGRVKTGRDIFLWATLGLVIIFSAYAILTFVFNALR